MKAWTAASDDLIAGIRDGAPTYKIERRRQIRLRQKRLLKNC
jgi:hypothetical protein